MRELCSAVITFVQCSEKCLLQRCIVCGCTPVLTSLSPLHCTLMAYSLEDSFDLPLSGQTTDLPDPTGITSPHPKIAWAGQTGFPGAKYCCICSYSTRLKEVTPCSQTDCPNQACTDCHSDGPFLCSKTEELRLARGIQHQVTHVLPDAPEPTPHTTPDSQAAPSTPPPHRSPAVTEEDIAVREELLTNPPEALVDIILSLRGELYTYKGIVEGYRKHKNWLLKQRSAIVETLSAIDGHALVEQQASLPTPTTQATSALPSKIDADWQGLCSTHTHWQAWWDSGKPQRLRKVTRDDDSARPAPPPPSRSPHPPATTRSRPTSPAHSRQHQATTTTSPPTSPARPHPRHHQTTSKRTTAASHNHRHSQPASTPHPHRGSFSQRKKRGGQKARGNLNCDRCRQRGHATRHCEAVLCDFCGHIGHRADQCRKRKEEERRSLRCDYCLRPGHVADSCFTRAAEARQERLFRALLSERQSLPGYPVHTPTRQAAPLHLGHPTQQYGARSDTIPPSFY